MKIFSKDISEEKTFEKFGDIFTQIRNNPETGWWLYKRVRKDNPSKIHYEVVKGVKRKNPDGTIVYSYPNSERWEIYGYTVDNNRYADRIIEFLMGATSRSAQEIYEFKKTLK